MAFLDFLSGGTKNNAADAAMPYLNKVPGVGEQYYSPFVNQGQQAFQQSGNTYGQMAQDPSSFLEAIMANYKPSQGYQLKEKNALQAANAAAAAGGSLGNDLDIQRRAQLVSDVQGQDYQQYINNILGIQGQGLQGQQNQGQMGLQASGNLADYLGQAYNNQGQTAYAGQAQQNQNQSNFLNQLLEMGGTLGGAALGGPIGGVLGKKLGGMLGSGGDNSASTSFMQGAFGGGMNNPGNFQQWYGR